MPALRPLLCKAFSEQTAPTPAVTMLPCPLVTVDGTTGGAVCKRAAMVVCKHRLDQVYHASEYFELWNTE